MTKEINIIIGGFDDGRTPNVQQYDVGSRMFLCRLWEKPGVAYAMAENAFVGVVFEWRRAKPTGEYETQVIDRSTVLVTVPGAATQIAGAVEMQLVIHQSGGQLYGPKITFMALESLKASDVEPEEPKLLLETLIEKTQKAADRVDQMQIDASGLAGDSNKLGGKPPEYYIQPRNLLDNSYFERMDEIVNQRGQSSYAVKGYTIDRWRSNSENISVSVGNGLTLKNKEASANRVFFQLIDRTDIIGKPLTYAICLSDNTVVITNGTVGAEIGTLTNTKHFAEKGGYIAFCNENGKPAVWIAVMAGSTVAVKWAALYEGTYTAETLPPYVPKGYATELMACLRYAKKIDMAYITFVALSPTTGYAGVDLSVPPNNTVNKSIHVTNVGSIRGGGAEIVPTNVSINALHQSQAIIRAEGNFTPNTVYQWIDFSALISFEL